MDETACIGTLAQESIFTLAQEVMNLLHYCLDLSGCKVNILLKIYISIHIAS